MNNDNQEIPLNILLVDDDETFCHVLGQALKNRNFNVFIANDIKTGDELNKENDIPYAIVDLRIGHESGLEMVEKLSAQNKAMRIVVLTGYASITTAV